MKKFLSLILIVVVVPLVFCFSGCNEQQIYDLSNLQIDYYSIANNYENVEIVNGELSFNYAGYSQELKNAINTTTPYTYIKNFDEIFKNSLLLTNSYIEKCCSNKENISNELKNEIKAKLDSLNSQISNVNYNLGLVDDIIRHETASSILSNSCMQRYKNLVDAYKELIVVSLDFNNAIADLYFNNVLVEYNKNYYLIGETNFSADDLISTLNARKSYLVGRLTENYMEMYLDNSSLLKSFSQPSFGSFNMNSNNYKANCDSLKNASVNVELLTQKYNGASKNEGYECAVSLYNAESQIRTDKNSYNFAKNNYNYTEIMAKEENFRSTREIEAVNVINKQQNILKEYLSTIKILLNVT